MRRSRRHRSLVRFVSAYNATGRSAQQTVMNGVMARGSANNGPFDTPFRLCRNWCKRQSEADCSNTENVSHARHNRTSKLFTVPKPQLSDLVPHASGHTFSGTSTHPKYNEHILVELVTFLRGNKLLHSDQSTNIVEYFVDERAFGLRTGEHHRLV